MHSVSALSDSAPVGASRPRALSLADAAPDQHPLRRLRGAMDKAGETLWDLAAEQSLKSRVLLEGNKPYFKCARASACH